MSTLAQVIGLSVVATVFLIRLATAVYRARIDGQIAARIPVSRPESWPLFGELADRPSPTDKEPGTGSTQAA